LIKASLRKGTDKIDAEGGRIIKMYYYANKELYIIIIIIINNGGKVICLPNFVWGTYVEIGDISSYNFTHGFVYHIS
jgi:hypothetical protein